MIKTIFKSFAASILIGLGCYCLLKVGSPLGELLFSLGLMSVCVLGANLFTGKCGFLIEDKNPKKFALELLIILAGNLVMGYIIGRLFALSDSSLIPIAQQRVNTWNWSLAYFLKSIFCGIIMYLAVKMYKKGNLWGILLGVPLFLFCGFQHSIANVIMMGVAGGLYTPLFLCVGGNWTGSLIISYLLKEQNDK